MLKTLKELIIRIFICYLELMRKFAVLILLLLCTGSVFAKGTESKTFLVLFKAKELKSWKISLKDIESQFSSFKTRTYTGNSELALLIDIPACEFDECFLGQFLVETESGQDLKLQDIAFRLFDMTECQKNLQVYLTAYEESLQKKKNSKHEKVTPTP